MFLSKISIYSVPLFIVPNLIEYHIFYKDSIELFLQSYA